MIESVLTDEPGESVPYAGDLTLKDLAWCADVDAARLRAWASAGRLAIRPPFSEHDAVEAAIAFAVPRQGVSQKVATQAWTAIRADVRQLLLQREDDLWAVVSADGPQASVVVGAAAAARAAVTAARCWVVALGPSIDMARQRYAELSSLLDVPLGHVTPITEAQQSVRENR